MRTILFLVRKEYLQVFRDRAMLVIIFGVPIVQLLVLSNAATFEVDDIGVHLVDEDRTRTSRGLATRLTASGYFDITRRSTSPAQASEDLLRRDVSMILRVPRDFERDLVRAGEARVQIVQNAEDGAAAAIAQAYAATILADHSAELGAELRPTLETVRSAPEPPPHASPDPRIAIHRRGWYNADLDYHAYMVPGLLALLVTMTGTLLSAINITREREMGTLEQLNVTPITKAQFITGKLLPFWILGLAQLALGLGVGKAAFDIPIQGNLALLFSGAALYLVVALGIGLWISTVTETQQQAMFVTYFILIVYIFLSGFLTPISSMPRWAQIVAEANPLAHFIEIIRAVLIKGADAAAVARPLVILAGYGAAVLALAVRQYSKTTA